MEKEMKPIRVNVVEPGIVRLEQDKYPEDTVIIEVSIEQIDLLCEWLQEAKSSYKT